MQILGIRNFKIPPTFTSNNIDRKPVYYVNKPDSFEKNDFNSKFNHFYNNIEAQLGIVTPSNIKSMALRISKKTDIPIEDVYKTMGILSQYSSYKSLKGLKKVLKDNNIFMISNMVPFYTDDNVNYSPCLTNVLHYIGLKNLRYSKDNASYTYMHKALFIDSDLIKTINKMPYNDKKRIYKEVFEKENIIPVYIENFENGYNFINQEKTFEDHTLDTLNKAKIYSNKNNQTIENSVLSILNNKNYKDIKNLGLNNILVIKKDYPTTAEQIAENLNPIIPTRKDMIDEIENMANRYISYESDENNREMYKYNTYNDYYDFMDEIDKENNKNEILRYMEHMTIAISPHKYCEYMKDLHNKINKFVEEKGKSTNDIYYLIPSKNKSFVLTNYIYQKVNKIKNPKNIYSSRYNYRDLGEKIPPNSTLVILDDCSISALSYTTDLFDYENISNIINPKDNINIVFAPMLMTDFAMNKIKSLIKENNRENIDAIVYSEKIPTWDENPDSYSIIYQKTTPRTSPYMTLLTLPYMGPDSNCDELIPIYNKFFIDSSAQKSYSHDEHPSYKFYL